MTRHARREDARTGLLLGGLFVAALTLRPQLIAVGPLYEQIETELGFSHTVGGLLTALPALSLGVFAPLVPAVASRFGHLRATTWCVTLIAVASLVRAGAPGTVTLLLGTVAIGVGMAIAGSLLPVVVKSALPHRPAAATGVYAGGIQLGAAAAAVGVVPIAAQVGWRGALAFLAVATGVCAVAWHRMAVRNVQRVSMVRAALPWGDPLVWRLGAVFALQAMPYFALNAWLPPHLVEIGWTASSAGGAQAALNVASLSSSLTVPAVMDRRGQRRWYIVASALVTGASLAGLLLVPSLTWLLLVPMGLAMGVLFATALVLPLDVTSGPAEAAAVSGVVLGVGYAAAAAAPVITGAVRDLTGSFVAALLVVPLSMIVLVMVTWGLTPQRLATARAEH